MGRFKYVLVALLLVGLVASGAFCVLINRDSNANDTSGAPIFANWTPLYVDDDIGDPIAGSDLAEMLAPTVVSIISEKFSYDWLYRPVPETGAGSGVIIDPQGLIVTNEHVVRDAETLTVILSDGSEFTAVGWVRDTTTDLAVVQIEPDRELPYAHFLSNSLDNLELLEDVVAVGNALALSGGPTWSKGVVSNLGRPIQVSGGGVLEDLIQTDAAINPGNSGGPLVNMAGQVVGINTAVAPDFENIGFAISTDVAIPAINSLVTEGFVSVAYLGVKMLSVTPAVQSEYDLSVDSGAFILEVVSGSPAAQAGLRGNDVITRFGDTDIDDADQLKEAIVGREIGDVVAITYVRGQSTFTTEATLVQRPS
jgi:serine protease Do